jgi:hypothetical protein
MPLVVGGHSRHTGKTAAAAGPIERLPEFAWAALTIAQLESGTCVHERHPCACGPEPRHPFARSE